MSSTASEPDDPGERGDDVDPVVEPGVPDRVVVRPHVEEVGVDAVEHVGRAEQHGHLADDAGLEHDEQGGEDVGDEEDGHDGDGGVGAPRGQGRDGSRDGTHGGRDDERDRERGRQRRHLVADAAPEVVGHEHAAHEEDDLRRKHQHEQRQEQAQHARQCVVDT